MVPWELEFTNIPFMGIVNSALVMGQAAELQ
jgi:hypothetical protein